jgi:regulatory helix-turn-helix LysR family protein
MISEQATVEMVETSLGRRFNLAEQGHLKVVPRDETKECQNYVKAKSVQLRLIDLNLFRVFDTMMLHRSVRKASQILSVTPSAVSHALSRLRQSIGDDAELKAVTDAGFTSGEVSEIVAPVVVNIFTNYFNNVARTQVDSPWANPTKAA